LRFWDGAKNGAIAISLGTNVQWKSIDEDKLEIVALALSKIKQRVLWKLDIEVPFQMSDNVMTVKWMPQDKVLSTFLDIIYIYIYIRTYTYIYIHIHKYMYIKCSKSNFGRIT